MIETPSDPAPLRKARGAFFTPPEVAAYVIEWAIRSADDRVLEPSCGEAAFLEPAVRRLQALGAGSDLRSQVHGVEVHEASAVTARERVAAACADVSVRVGDFLRGEPTPHYSAVVGNPPYVRYQAFAGRARAVAKQAALRAGVTLTNLASSWAAFTVHSVLHVAPGGRLGLVLPAEILSVNYAAPVRELLMAQFARVRLVVFTERVFPGVMEDVVLVLAEGRGAGPAGHCELVHAHNAADLGSPQEARVRCWSPGDSGRWSPALVTPEAGEAYAEAVAGPGFAALQAWGETTLGMVTGNNGFFALRATEVAARRLTSRDVVRISPPGSRHLRGLTLTADALEHLEERGHPTWLFRPEGAPSPAGRSYIHEGEKRGVDQAYKCRVRQPWWRVPQVPPADLLLTYMNADTARLCTNTAAVRHLNSVHGVYLCDDRRDIGRSLLPLAALNSVTLLGAELVGRSYGGGVLKIEPREADRWPMPAPYIVRERADALRGVRRRVRDLLAQGRMVDASHLVDDALLDGLVAPAALALVRAGRAQMHARRSGRSKGARPARPPAGHTTGPGAGG